MRSAFVSVTALLWASLALAQCPPSCSGGGGPASSDCFLTFGGISGPKVTCTDGDPSCDADGAIDGVCTLRLTACTNVAVGSCPATPLDGAPTAIQKGIGAGDFLAALAALSPSTQSCTEPGLIKLAIALSPVKLKPAKLTLRITSSAGGKKDKDTLKITCNPGRPTLAANIQPIFNDTCTFAGCHSGALPQSSLWLEPGQSAAGLAGKALLSPTTARVKPGSLKKSYLTKSLLGSGARQMPDGCPNVVPPVERCLTNAEIYTMLAWIQAGAQ